MPRSRKDPLFELGRYWIGVEPGRPGFWRFWYDAGTARVRRAKLGALDLEAAKLELAELVVKGERKSPASPLGAVLLAYFETRTDKLPSAKAARAAGRLLLAQFGPEATVAEIDAASCAGFARATAGQGLTLAYTSRTLSVLAAALRHAGLRDVSCPYGPAWLADLKLAWPARPPRRAPQLTDDQVAAFLSAPLAEPVYRWALVSLLTGARPEAVLDLTPAQRDREHGLIRLNPEGRAQNKKHRPVVRASGLLTTLLDAWEAQALAAEAAGTPSAYAPRYVAYARVDSIDSALQRLDLPFRVSAYSLRHKVGTVLRRAKRSHGVTEDEIAALLGHRRPHLRTTQGYGEFDPDYLDGPAEALAAWLMGLGFSRRTPASVYGRSHGPAAPLKKSA